MNAPAPRINAAGLEAEATTLPERLRIHAGRPTTPPATRLLLVEAALRLEELAARIERARLEEF